MDGERLGRGADGAGFLKTRVADWHSALPDQQRLRCYTGGLATRNLSAVPGPATTLRGDREQRRAY